RLDTIAKSHRAAAVVGRRLDVVGAEIMMKPVERRVQGRAVKTLVEVQDDQLPVGLDVVHDAASQPQIAHAIGGEALRQIPKLVLQRSQLRLSILPVFFALAPGPHRLHPNAAAALGTPPRRELTLMRRRRLCLAATAAWPQAPPVLPILPILPILPVLPIPPILPILPLQPKKHEHVPIPHVASGA